MASSTIFDFVVEPDEHHWTVNFDGQHCGRFESRLQALRSAVWDAKRVRDLGQRVRVLVHYHGGARSRVVLAVQAS